MKKFTLCFLLISLILPTAFAQFKKHPIVQKTEGAAMNATSLKSIKPLKRNIQNPANPFRGTSIQYSSIRNFTMPVRTRFELDVVQWSAQGLPIMIKGTLSPELERRSSAISDKAFQYLDQASNLLQIENVEKEFKIYENYKDEFDESHIKIKQQYKGIEVFGSELVLHTKKAKINLLNGRHFPTPKIEKISPSLSKSEVATLVQKKIAEFSTFRPFSESEKKLVPREQIISKLIIFHKDFDAEKERLAWEVSIYGTLLSKWFFIIDAHTGEVLLQHSDICKIDGGLHVEHSHIDGEAKHTNLSVQIANENEMSPPAGGPVKVKSNDLFGIERILDVWENNGIYHMIDASKSMYDPTKSNLPEDGKGVIATLDAKNRKPSIFGGYSASDVTSENNGWTTLGVSAHYNSSVVYDYFKNTFDRNGIDGNGGNMFSFINVVDENGSAMDNAFYADGNMYYGNGKDAFEPLAKALDVAAHEISHGVIAKTANLVYLQQAGALNESFADVFGALIDRDDYKMGEDVVRSQFFPTGALRDLQNPNNGAQRLQRGWQPKHMDEFVALPDSIDNGGVHINSGIPNRAFYLYATAVGKDKAEQVYYKALRDYLTRSSQFIDCRLAVIQAAVDIYGANSAEASAAGSAFDGVGIFGQGGNTTPNDYQEDVAVNPGEDFVVYTDKDLSKLFLYDFNQSFSLSETSILSKPSITDDGSLIVFVAKDKTLKAIDIDWSANPVSFNESTLDDTPVYRNAAISKDGLRLAALTEDGENQVFVYDFIGQNWNTFILNNPTTAEGVSSGNVLYADVLEWDFSGEFILYDAFNRIPKDNGPDIEFWDIGFLKAWDDSGERFGDGLILKLISDLPDDTSVGNPTFAKNSPYIVAFDFLDDEDQNFVLGANTENGDVGTIYENTIVGYPNYSRLDDKLIFDAESTADDPVLGIINLDSDKINAGTADPFVLVGDAKWGVWFAPGERELTSTDENSLLEKAIKVFPNPFQDELIIEIDELYNKDFTLHLYNLMGQEVFKQAITKGRTSLSANSLPTGAYILQISNGERVSSKKLVKF